MNIEKIITVAKEKLGSTEIIKEGLYRGNISIDEKNAGMFFIDFNSVVTTENFNDYQEQLLSNVYYDLDKTIQWNFYLFLLRDTIDPKVKSHIERNDRYARKYVFKENEFIDFLTVDKSKESIQVSIIDEWKELLDKAGIGDVYGDAKLKDIVVKLETNALVGIAKTAKKATNANSDKIKFINTVELKDNYRTHPVEPRKFHFGKVNLISGINGSGKTSLFEAIEIGLCGMSYRNSQVKEKDGCIEIRYNNSRQVEICKPSFIEIYRKRELDWYGNSSAKFNRTHYSFNRFNYFNADAAHDFANSNDDYSVVRALYNIVLGPEYNYITDRVEKVLKEVRPIFNNLDRDYTDWLRRFEEADLFLKVWTPNPAITSLIDEIENDIIRLKPISNLGKVSENHIPFERLLSDLILRIGQLLNKNVTGFQQVIEKANNIEKQKKRIESFKVFLNENQLYLKQKNDTKNDYLFTLDQLVRSKAYFLDVDLFKIEGLADRISVLKVVLEKKKEVDQILSNPNIQKLNSNLSFKELNLQFEEMHDTASSILSELSLTLKNQLEGLEKTQRLVKEIKLLGKNYIDSNPNTASCPLCDTSFAKESLLAIITKVDELGVDKNAYSFSDQNNKIELQKAIIEDCKSELKLLNSIKVLFASIYADEPVEEKTIPSIIEAFEKYLILNAGSQNKLDEEKYFQQNAKRAQLTEQDFSILKIELEKKFPLIKFIPSNKAEFKKAEDDILGQISIIDEEIRGANDRMREEVVSVKTDLELQLDQSYTAKQLESNMAALDQEKDELLGLFNQLKQLVDNDFLDIQVLKIEVEKIQNKLKIYIDNLGNEQRFQSMTVQKSNAESFISKNKDKHGKYRLAVETLNKIKANSGTEQVNAFFRSHLEEIIDVFKSIHMPKEFSSITIEADDRVNLKTISNEKRSITQISTGQRSALAIAIFLTLNRSVKNAPDIIMFDDPVAFIDDLNALSFLDYLRFFALKDKKQIFFATANLKLAKLFERKFEFLGDDFKKWDLERPSEVTA